MTAGRGGRSADGRIATWLRDCGSARVGHRRVVGDVPGGRGRAMARPASRAVLRRVQVFGGRAFDFYVSGVRVGLTPRRDPRAGSSAEAQGARRGEVRGVGCASGIRRAGDVGHTGERTGRAADELFAERGVDTGVGRLAADLGDGVRHGDGGIVGDLLAGAPAACSDRADERGDADCAAGRPCWEHLADHFAAGGCACEAGRRRDDAGW